MTKKHYIDLFAGCGGLSLGMMNAGWKGLFSVEKNKDAFLTLGFNLIHKYPHYESWPEWLPQTTHDINELLQKYKTELIDLQGKVDLVVGGPPCQGFSTAGKRDEQDERNQLAHSYIDFIRLTLPSIIFFENVRGFTQTFVKHNPKGTPYSQIVEEGLRKLGYNVKPKIIDFSEFGLPQRRKRFILIGGLNFDPDAFFYKLDVQKTKFLKEKGIKPRVTVNDAISDLRRTNGVQISPDSTNFTAGTYSEISSQYQNLMRRNNGESHEIVDSHRFANHTEKIIERFSFLINNAPHGKELKQILTQKYGLKKRTMVVLDKNSVSPTLTSLPDDCIHFAEPRILTVREYARLQSFPDWFEFKGKYTTGASLRKKEVPRYTQVANAIPPLFAEQVGNVLREMLKDA